jgi:hypothetical protein
MRQAFAEPTGGTSSASHEHLFNALSSYSLGGSRGPTAKEMVNTTREEEYVRPRHSVIPGLLMHGRSGLDRDEGGRRRRGWDLDGLKGDVDVGACESRPPDSRGAGMS